MGQPSNPEAQSLSDRDLKCMVGPSVDYSQQDKVYVVTCNGCKESVGIPIKADLRVTDPGSEPRLKYIGITGTSMNARVRSHAQFCSHRGSQMIRSAATEDPM